MLIGISGKAGSGKDLAGSIIQELDSSFIIKRFADKLKDIICLLIGCTREQLENREFKERELGEEWVRYMLKGLGPPCFATKKEAKAVSRDLFIDAGISSTVISDALTPRKLLQLMGTECGRQILHPNLWVNALINDYKGINTIKLDSILVGNDYTIPPHPAIDNDLWGEHIPTSQIKVTLDLPVKPDWIITDVRFPNEADAILAKGGIVIRLERDTELRYPELWSQFQKQDNHDEWGMFLKSIDKYDSVYHYSESSLDSYSKFNATIFNDNTVENLKESLKFVLKKHEII